MRTTTLTGILIACLTILTGGCGLNGTGEVKTSASANPASAESNPEMAAALAMIERLPDSPGGYVQVAVLHIRRARETGDFSLNAKAEVAVQKALEISPGDMPSRKLKGSLLLTFHRFAEALEYGTQLDRDIPNDAFVQGLLTDANLELGNYEAAIAAAQRMVDLRPNSSSYARGAHLRSLHGDHAGAVDLYKMAARSTDPKDKEAQSWCLVQLGDEYLSNGKFAEAEKVYDEALANLPDFYLAVAAKGKVRAALGDLDGAERILVPLLNRVPNVESAILLGDIYTKKNELEKAKSQYALAEAMEQKIGVNADQKRLAVMWADQNQRLPEALQIMRRESEARKDIYTEDALAWALLKNGELKEAQESIKRAMRTKVNDAKILFHAGMIESALGNRAEASRLIKASLKLNSSFDLIQADVAQRTLAELERKAS